MGWKLKVGEGSVSIAIGKVLDDLGRKVMESDPLLGAAIVLAGWIIMFINLLIFADGMVERLSMTLGKNE